MNGASVLSLWKKSFNFEYQKSFGNVKEKTYRFASENYDERNVASGGNFSKPRLVECAIRKRLL